MEERQDRVVEQQLGYKDLDDRKDLLFIGMKF